LIVTIISKISKKCNENIKLLTIEGHLRDYTILHLDFQRNLVSG
jgi:hypothetical protein